MIYFSASHLVVAVALFIVACVILYTVSQIRDELRTQRASLEQVARAAARRAPFPSPNHHGRFTHHGHEDGATHFAIWMWRGERWELDPASIPPGVDAGLPPNFAGTYRDQCVKTPCP